MWQRVLSLGKYMVPNTMASSTREFYHYLFNDIKKAHHRYTYTYASNGAGELAWFLQQDMIKLTTTMSVWACVCESVCVSMCACGEGRGRGTSVVKRVQ